MKQLGSLKSMDMKAKKTIAIIPARGGSKGIPGKNIRPFSGKPLLAWTIEAAHAANSIDRVIVSTDDDAIEVVALAYGAEVVKRPLSLATDTASSESALLHVLQTIAKKGEAPPTHLAFLQCTSPLTTATDIDGTMQLVQEEGFDTAVTMTPFHYFIWEQDENGNMHGINHEATRRLMRQEREPAYQEVGAVYAMRVDGFLQHEFRFFGRIGKYIVSPAYAVEIDNPDDWHTAEALMVQMGRADTPQPTFDRIKAIVTDFDGVLTDNKVHLSQDGTESVTCNRGDGWGIHMLKEAGYRVACISTEKNPVVAARCQKLDIPYWQGQDDKLSALKSYLADERLTAAQCLYVGNDTNDLDCLRFVQVAVVPQDAADSVKEDGFWITKTSGGDGVLREIAAMLLAQTGEPA